MRLMGPEGGRADVVAAGVGVHEGSASPPGSANTNPPPSPSLYDIGDDDATPRQQWSPVHTVGGSGGGAMKPSRTRGHHGGSSGGGTFAGVDGGELRAPAGKSNSSGAGDSTWGGGGSARNGNSKGGSSSNNTNIALSHQNKPRVASPDSPVLRVDLERLDLSVLALGEEGGPAIPADGRAGGGSAAASSGGRNNNNSELLHSRTFCSEPGGRPRSLGGRPSRAHALFVAPGKIGTGPASPPSSYSTHSESGGFASPTVRLASPFGLSSAGAGKGEHHHHHQQQQQQQQQQQFHPQQGRVKKGHWKKGKPIGVGSCGNVYLGMNEDTGELMAVKEITLETKDRLLTSLYNEIQVMHKLVHPHIVGYLGAELQDSKRKLCIFQEWVPAGSLHSLLGQFGALSDAMTRKYTRQVLEGLVYLHANRVIHRDVKSKNILVDDRGNVKLADFGCALVLKDDNGDGVEMSMKGTPLFMAPEMLLKRKCGKRVDVWSLGCAVLEMVTTRPPWADTFKHPVEIIEHFSENPGPPPLPEDLSPALREFLLSCFTWEAGRRPTSHQLVAHEYLLRDWRVSAVRGGDGTGSSGSGEDNDIPLEAMGRAPFMTRMRRCSSATLPELMQRSHAFGGRGGGGDPLAAFGTAPSGTLRPPSPRYGPGGVAAVNSKRTPTRRRMYTESSSGSYSSAMPPPEGGGSAKPSAAGAVASAVAGATAAGGGTGGGVYQVAGGGAPGTGLVRRASMPHAGRSPPVSPDKPRRPGRGSSPGRCSSAVPMQHYHHHHHSHHNHHNHHLQAEEERLGSGPVGHARLRSMGDGIAGTGFGAATSGSSSSSGGGGERGGSGSSESGGRTDSEASVSRSSSGGRGAPAGVGAGGGHAMRKAAPTPTLPPIVRELLGTLEQGGGLREGEGGLLLHSGDTPPPMVRPLERSASGQPGQRGWRTAGGGNANPTAKATLLQQRSKAAGGGGSGRGGEWGVSDSRGGGGGASRQMANEPGE